MEKLEKYALAGLLILAVLILFVKLGSFPLQMQWEPNYGQVVREMVWGEGDFITPACKVGSDEGAPSGTFWSKPIMIFWMSYPLYWITGSDSEWNARIPIALIGLLGIYMTFWFMGRLFNRRVGLLSGLLLLTTPAYFLISRTFMVDTPFVVFMWIAIGYLLLGEKEKKPFYTYMFYVFMALSFLTKGLLPLILVGGTLALYIMISLDWRILKRMHLPTGILIFLAVGFPWYIYMWTKYGNFYIEKFFWSHHFDRAMGKLDKPDDSFEMFVLYFCVGVLPWITFLPQAIANILPWGKRDADKPSLELFFLAGFICCFGFFSIISTKFVHYIFPTVPFTVAMLAIYFDKLLDDNRSGNLNRLIFLAALVVLAIIAPDILDQKNYRNIFYFITTERLQDWHPAVANPAAWFIPLYFLWGLVLAGGFVFRKFNRWILVALTIISVVYAFYINTHMIPRLTEMFSASGMIEKYLELRSGPDEPLGEFTQTWKSRSIKYYLPFDEMKKNGYMAHRVRNDISSVRQWYNKYRGKRIFIIIEQKQKHFSRLNALWEEVSGGEQLVKIFDDGVPGEPYNPEFWLVSNRDNAGQAKKISQEELNKQLGEFVSDKPFEPKKKAEVQFDKGIKLLGYDLKPEGRIKRGQDLEITMYFQATQNVTQSYEIFVHVEPMTNPTYRHRGDHVPVDGRYPTNRWTEGQYIKDSYKVSIPPDAQMEKLGIFVGFFKGKTRLNPENSPLRDREGRLNLGEIEVTM